jgi:coenzyme F420-reducing hydrogenase beta subunit
MLCEIKKCFGCMACYNICPVNAIKIIEDEEGFLRPKIQEDKCIGCKKCTSVCAAIEDVERDNKTFEQQTYACWNKDKDIRRNSTSGGLFTVIANNILKENGVVFGASFDNKLNVIHSAIDNKKDIVKFRGSKYVQSNIGSTYKESKEFLDKGKSVLFTGTPCQIAGLYKFLGKEYHNLYTCDLICHGVPSPKVYKSYINYMENKYKSPIKNINFRDKKTGWKVYSVQINFQSGKTYTKSNLEDPYSRGFLRDYFIRPSCSNCQYTNINRNGDITIADFWGYKSTNEKDFNDDKGISLAIINSKNGERLFQLCKNDLVYFKRDIDEAIKGNRCLSSCFPPSPKRKEFWEDYNSKPFKYVIKKYMYAEPVPLKTKVRRKIGSILSKETKAKVKKILNK